MGNTDKYLTMAKYSNNDNKDVNNMMEEERRSKAYSKIVGAQTSQTFVIGCFCHKKGSRYSFRRLTVKEPLLLTSSATQTDSVPKLFRPSTKKRFTR